MLIFVAYSVGLKNQHRKQLRLRARRSLVRRFHLTQQSVRARLTRHRHDGSNRGVDL